MRFDIDVASSGTIPKLKADIPLREGVINREIFETRKMVASEIRRLGLPIMYPASGTDGYFSIALTQALKAILVDPALGDPMERKYLDASINELHATNVQYSEDGRILTFSCGVPPEGRELFLYPNDATVVLPREANNGLAAVLFKAPTQHGDLGDLVTKEGPEQMLEKVVKDGFVISNMDIFWLLTPGQFLVMRNPSTFRIQKPVVDRFWVYKKI